MEKRFWHLRGKACRDHEAIITSRLEAGLGAERIHRELPADWLDPDINPKFEAFCRHYGTSVMPCHPHKAQHKGKVERGIRHVKNSLIAASAMAHNLTVAMRNTRVFKKHQSFVDKPCRNGSPPLLSRT